MNFNPDISFKIFSRFNKYLTGVIFLLSHLLTLKLLWSSLIEPNNINSIKEMILYLVVWIVILAFCVPLVFVIHLIKALVELLIVSFKKYKTQTIFCLVIFALMLTSPLLLRRIANEGVCKQCILRINNLSDKEKIAEAFDKLRLSRRVETIVRSGYVAKNSELPGNTTGVPYEGINSFLRLNPNCCFVYGNVVHLDYKKRFYDHEKSYQEEETSISFNLNECEKILANFPDKKSKFNEKSDCVFKGKIFSNREIIQIFLDTMNSDLLISDGRISEPVKGQLDRPVKVTKVEKRYKNTDEFLKYNPDCCKIKNRPNSFGGYEVRIDYKKRYITSKSYYRDYRPNEKNEQTVMVSEVMTLDRCGQVIERKSTK